MIFEVRAADEQVRNVRVVEKVRGHGMAHFIGRRPVPEHTEHKVFVATESRRGGVEEPRLLLDGVRDVRGVVAQRMRGCKVLQRFGVVREDGVEQGAAAELLLGSACAATGGTMPDLHEGLKLDVELFECWEGRQRTAVRPASPPPQDGGAVKVSQDAPVGKNRQDRCHGAAWRGRRRVAHAPGEGRRDPGSLRHPRGKRRHGGAVRREGRRGSAGARAG